MAFPPCHWLFTALNRLPILKQLCPWLTSIFLLCMAFTLNRSNLVQRLLYMVCLPFDILHGIETNMSKLFLFLPVEPEYCSSEIAADDQRHSLDGDMKIHGRDVEMLMRNLGSPEGEKLKEVISPHELSQLFEVTEPSLEEVKEAFDAFDENKDGFIDARELQRVLCLLGLMEGIDLENCTSMIKTFDQNGDGRIDVSEFVGLMETSFCSSN